MRLVGWVMIPALILGFVGYSPGFVWGILPDALEMGPAHPPSPYDGLHPYVFMLVALYAAWGILANLLHGLVMVPQAFLYPNEHAHLWADIPLTVVLAGLMWVWHPDRPREAPS